MEEAKKMKSYKRLIYKQFVQVSGLWGPQFLSYRKIPKINPGAYIFQRPYSGGLFLEGLIFEGAYIWRKICVSKSIGLASLIVERKLRFCFVLFCIWGQFLSTNPRGAYIWRGDLTEGVWRAYIWRGLYMEGFISGILRYLRNVSRTFVELCMETPCWCTVLVHQSGCRKLTKTSGFHFFCKSYFFSLEN